MMMERTLKAMLLAGLLALPATADAQQPPPQESDPFAAVLFPPELIMQHSRAIRLSDAQRREITGLIGNVQQRVLDLQWQLAEQVAALKQTLSGARVDQDRAIDQLNRVLETEKRIKQAHLEMLVRIKNLLRPEQQTELARLRSAAGDEGDEIEPEGDT